MLTISQGPRNIIQFNNATLTYKNFGGLERRNPKNPQEILNRAGDRNFCICIGDYDNNGIFVPNYEIADTLESLGFTVKKKVRQRVDQDGLPIGDPIDFLFLKVNVKYRKDSDANGNPVVKGPKVFLQSGNTTIQLKEDTLGTVDNIRIVGCDIDIRPYNWNVVGKTGTTAYLNSIWIKQDIDRFDERYNEMMMSEGDAYNE